MIDIRQTQRDRDYVRPTFTKEQLQALSNTVGQVINTQVGTINALMSFSLYDARNLLMKTPLFKHQGKKALNEAVKVYESYERMMKTEIFSPDTSCVWLDLTDNFQEKLKPYVDQLHQQIWNFLVRYEIPYAKERAMLEVARVMCVIACYYYDKTMDGIFKSSGVHFAEYWLSMRMTKCQTLIDTACDTILHLGGKDDIDINDDVHVRNAMTILSTKVFDQELMNNASISTLIENGDLVEEGALEELIEARDEKEREEAERKEKAKKAEIKRRESDKKKHASEITKDDLEALKEKFNSKK